MGQTLRASPQIVNDYLRLFVNRRAYTMQSDLRACSNMRTSASKNPSS
jgi:hypothetical protein